MRWLENVEHSWHQGVDTCRGDGGAPLVCQQSQGKWYQAGIVSYGIGCGEDAIPGVYSDVSSAVCWIDQQVSDFYGDQSYYDFERSECPWILKILYHHIMTKQ